jgi:pimeloyl-ACP methyl ester carboxylesterase
METSFGLAALPNGITLHHASVGSGRLVLFVHGFPEFWYEWKDLLPDFGRDHHAVAPDLRGYNLSASPPPCATIAPATWWKICACSSVIWDTSAA